MNKWTPRSIEQFEAMDQRIISRVAEEFFGDSTVMQFKRGYYCEKLAYETLNTLLHRRYPRAILILWRVDHIIVREETKLRVLFLRSHHLGLCTSLHRGGTYIPSSTVPTILITVQLF